MLLFMRRAKRNIPLTGRLLSPDINHRHGNETVLTKGETDGGIQMQTFRPPPSPSSPPTLRITSGHFNVGRQLLNGQLGEATCECDGIFQGEDAGSSFPLSTGRIWQLLLENVQLQEVSEWLSLEQIWSLWGKKQKK